MYAPIRRFSQTDISGKRLRSWGTCTIPSSSTLRGLSPAIGRSPYVIVPLLGFSRPLIARSTVDLPAPFGPIRHVIRSGSTSRSRPRSTSPYP